ncbi:class I SAM-dependent methyltransferase [Devosia sp. A449]
MADDETLAFYANNAADYVRDGGDRPTPRLVAFLDALTPGARILELGTGRGRDAAVMLERGFDVDATDASPELAAEASTRLGRMVRMLRFDELDAPATYDAVWACACLLHAPAAELTDDLRRIHAALRPGGLFTASFKAGTGEGRDRFGRYYNYPDRDTLLAHFRAAAGWSSLQLEEVAGNGYDRAPTQWLWVTART